MDSRHTEPHEQESSGSMLLSIREIRELIFPASPDRITFRGVVLYEMCWTGPYEADIEIIRRARGVLIVGKPRPQPDGTTILWCTIARVRHQFPRRN